MRQATIWIASVCSVFIALLPPAFNAASLSKAPEALYIEDPISFGGLFKILSNDIDSVVDTIELLKTEIKSEIKNEAENIIKPFRYQTKELIKYLEKSIHKTVDGFFKNIDNVESILGDTIRNIKIIGQNKTKKFLVQLELLIKDKEYKLNDILMCLNLTNDPESLEELLQALFDYPASKDKLGKLIKKNLDKIIYGQYLGLSKELQVKLKVEIKKLINYLDGFVDAARGKNETVGDEVEGFITRGSEDVIEDAIDKFVDKLFDDINKRNKKLLDNAIHIDKDVIISIGDTNTIL